MKNSWVRSSAALLAALALTLGGCGGGGGGDESPTTPEQPPPSTVSVKAALDSAAAQASNDTATNPQAAFSVLQGAGVPAVQVNSPPKVNFAVFSNGAVKTDITITGVSFIIAKLVPGTNGEPDKWTSYTYRKEVASSTVGPNGKPVLASAMQATTDPKQTDAALLAAQLVANPDGYYTYTFRADIKDPAWTTTSGTTSYSTNGVTFEPGLTHRVAIQLSYTNAAGTDRSRQSVHRLHHRRQRQVGGR